MYEEPVVSVHALTVKHPKRVVLRDLDLSVFAGETVAIMGPSGSGKSSLLNCIAGLIPAIAGEVVAAGVVMNEASLGKLAAHRLSKIGLIFQHGDLLPELTVFENVVMPALFLQRRGAHVKASELLTQLRIDHLARRHPHELSGGEVQRVGVARALVNTPAVVLADEPTGAVDRATAESVADLLVDAAAVSGAAVIVATHDVAVADRMSRVLHLRDGKLQSDQSVSCS